MLQFSPWIRYRIERPEAKFRLFCFPYAGGGASIYLNWVRSFSNEIEVCPIQLPGRQERIMETPIADLNEMIDALDEELLPCLDLPFVFFGHSMGSLLAYELTKRLQANGRMLPEVLIVSGRGSPDFPDEDDAIFDLPDKKFIEKIKELSGTPDCVFENEELMALALPCLRSDFRLIETYNYVGSDLLECDLFAFYGSDDEGSSIESIEAWSKMTKKGFGMQELRGGHFFLHDNEEMMQNTIESIIFRNQAATVIDC